MLTRFVSDNAWSAPEYVYPYDSNVSLKNTKLYVAGNLNINYSPFLDGLNDVSNNNFSLFYLTDKKQLSGLVDFNTSIGDKINKYPGVLGINAENGLINADTSFLECIPLYSHINDFELFFAAYNNTYTQISGASLTFSTVGFEPSSLEVGFSVNSQPPFFYANNTYLKDYIILPQGNMFTAVGAITSKLTNLNFCTYLSSSIYEFGEAQTTTLTISSLNGKLSGSDLAGYALTFGNTYYGDLTGDILNYFRRFCIQFKVIGQSIYRPPGYNINEIYTVPSAIVPGFSSTDTSSDIARALSAMFGEVKTGDDYRPTQVFIDVKDVSYNDSSVSMTLTHKLCGSLIEPYRYYDGRNDRKTVFTFNEIQKGINAGFYIRFSPYVEPTTVNFLLPPRFNSYNTILNKKAISDFKLTQFQNFKDYSFRPAFTFAFNENNNIFFDVYFIDDKILSLTHTLYERTAVLVSDDFNKKLYFVDNKFITDSNSELTNFSYLFDETSKELIIYKTIEDKIYAISNIDNKLEYVVVNSFRNIPSNCVLRLFSYGEMQRDYNKNLWASYARDLNTNNLNLNPERSISIKNNYLFHTEYNSIDKNINVNFIPLKNQLNEFYGIERQKNGVDFRDYHSLYTGDNTEKGNLHISTGYTTKNKQYVFKSGQTTWFHIPYNTTFVKTDINDANFVVNGAIAGISPVFSDRIWKKAGDYKYTSNLGSSKLEQTGQWLCAWLSGGEDGSDAIWVDRFYNPEIVTEIEAIKFTNNVEYIPSYKGKNYELGITDRRSNLKLEPGVWFAYSHIGKTDANKVVNYIKKDIVQEGIISPNLPTDGEYNFEGKYSGYISLENYKAPLNNFTLSFFGYSEDWNSIMGNQILGNYKDTGFGIYNFLEINPFTYYFNKNKASLYNIQNDRILNINLPPALSGKIVGMFRRGYNENFHVVLDDLDILEYDLNGVLIDRVIISHLVPNFDLRRILGVANNLNYGVVLLDDFTYLTVDLISNLAKYYTTLDRALMVNSQGENPSNIYSVYIDRENFVYIINGRCPIIRDDKLYFIDNSNQRLLKVFNLVTRQINTYIDTSRLEASPVSPVYNISFTNNEVPVSDVPYTRFNLNVLSGVGINFYPPDKKEYSLGISIFRGPYYFYDKTGKKIKTVPLNPIYVDLTGNSWIVQQEYDIRDGEDVSYSDRFGYSNFYDSEGIIFIGDPEYQEILAATNLTLGKVFIYNTRNYKLNPLCTIDIGPKPQVYDLSFSTLDTNILTFSRTISTFPLSANIIFSNGSEVFSSPYGEASNNRAVSAFTLAFTISSRTFTTQPYYPDSTISNRISATFIPPLTSIATIVQQLTSIFNKTVIPHPNPTYTNKLHLSSFFNFSVTQQNDSSFTVRVKNRYAGPTPLSANYDPATNKGEMEFVALNQFTTPAEINRYSATRVEPGVLSQGQDDQRFGTKIVAINDAAERFSNGKFNYVIVSSPAWAVNALPVGKLTLYENVDVSENTNEFVYASAYDFLPPRLDGNISFGTTLKKFDTLDTVNVPAELRGSSYFIAGAPSTNSSLAPFGSAFFYDTSYISPISPLSSCLIFTPMGPAQEEFGYKVGLTQEFIAVSSPLSSNPTYGSEGAITLYRYRYGAAVGSSLPESVKPFLIPVFITTVKAPEGKTRHRFGHEFAISYDYLAVASLSSEEYGAGNIVVDLFKNNHINENIVYRRPDGTTKVDSLYTEYNYLTTVGFPFTNDIRSLSSLSSFEISLDIYKDHMAVGAWCGDIQVFGNEQSKVVIYEIYKDRPIVVFDEYKENYNPLVFKKYRGKSVSLVQDRLITGTNFICNTGHSLVNAVSAIKESINRQNSILKGTVDVAGDTFFDLTVVANVSAEDEPPKLKNSINRSLSGSNKFILKGYTPGRSLNYSGEIINYAFTLGEETHILTDFDRIKSYDVYGDFKETIYLKQLGLSPNLSCTRFGICNVIEDSSVRESFSMIAANQEGQHYKIDFLPSTKKLLIDLIDTDYFNDFFFPSNNPGFENVVYYNFDITNCHFMESIIRVESKTPKLYFKLRLNNRLDYEDSLILTPQYATENLSKGWHHFGIVLDSVNGRYIGYIDTKEAFSFKFDASKYVFSNILTDNISVGSTPYYNNSNFDDFYRYRKPLFIANNIKMSDIKFYNVSLTQPELKFLSYTKLAPSDMKFQLDYGSRNYIDTISRVSKHKLPGRKSPFIDIIISDSLITDPSLQKYYETKIIADLKDYLPSYVRVNKIKWVTNKPNREKIVDGDINIGNTLTNVGGTSEDIILVKADAQAIQDAATQ